MAKNGRGLSEPVFSEKLLVIDKIYKYLETLDGYIVFSCTFEGDPCLIMSHKQLYDYPPLGMTSHCRIYVTAGEYVVHIILLREVERGSMLHCKHLVLFSHHFGVPISWWEFSTIEWTFRW